MGNQLEHPWIEKNTKEINSERIHCVVSSMQGWRVDMEDAHLAIIDLLPGMHLFGVFDGHGGPEVARYVESHLPKKLLWNQEFINKNYKKGIVQCYQELDEEMRANACLLLKPYQRFPTENSKAGCTAVILLIHGNNYLIANLGDSRIVAYYQDKTLKAFDTSHKPNDQTEKKRIEDAGGKVSNGRINKRLNLTWALGDFNFKSNIELPFHKQMVSSIPMFFEGEIDPSLSFFLLGCDGIWETKSDEKICAFLSEGKLNLKKQAEDLLEFVLGKNLQSKKGKDNMSLILVYFKQQD